MSEKKASILIVEDNESIAKMIEAILYMGDYQCDVCHDGVEAECVLKCKGFDLILLDIMLPGQDGYALMEKIKPLDVPVIFITAKLDVNDRVKGLRMGAEDYILKPFEPAELLARVEVVLRRMKKVELKSLIFQDVVINFMEHSVEKNGVRVELTPKEFEVLVYFIKNKNQVIRKERLMADVWGYDFGEGTRTVDIHVQRVRKKLELQNYLKTIPKIGYLLEGK